MKLIRSLIDSVKGKKEDKPWTFEPMVPARKEDPNEEKRAAEQAKQLKLGYSVEIVNKGEGVRYTEGLRYVEANLSWANGANVWLNTMCKWTKPDTRELTPVEFARVVQRMCEYLSCDGTPVALIDQTPPLKIEETVVADSILPRIASWSRLERHGKVIESRPPPVQS
jgi:hypothetical protein